MEARTMDCSIISSPRVPILRHNSSITTRCRTAHCHDFAARAGCDDDDRTPSDSSIFDCLVHADTEKLQYASGNVSTSGAWGTWAFLPVTDGELIQELPSKQLPEKKVGGKRMMSGE